MSSLTTAQRLRRVRGLALAAAAVAALAFPLAGRAASERSASGRLAARQLIVRFVPGTSPRVADAVLARAGLIRLHPAGNRRTLVARAPSAVAARRALARLQGERTVDYAGPDSVVQATTVPNDPGYAALQWPWDNPRFPTAWSSTTGSSSVVVAVVDSGVDASHEDLAGAVLPGYNFVAGNTDTTDDNGHGTEVAGIIAARGNNGVGLAGACWSCKILPVKVLGADGHGTYSNMESGVRWAADHGAQIINLSEGGAVDDPTLRDAIDYAVGKGAVVVLAAGNSSSSDPTAGTGGYPAYYAPGISGAISVGGADFTSTLYSWSNYGSWVELAASGCFVSTAKDGGYADVCGTSFAAPQVAGLAGLLLSAAPGTSPGQVEAQLEAHTLPVAGAHTVAGGLVDAGSDLGTPGSSAGPPALTASPALYGTSREGQTLTATAGGWSGADSTGYQWERSSDGGATWTAIAGATSATYTLASGDVGALVRVSVTAVNGVGSTSAPSNATARVEAASSAPPVSPGGATPDLTGELTTDRAPLLQGGVTYRLRVYAVPGSGVAPHATVRFTLPAQVQIAGYTLDHGRGCTLQGQTFDCDLDWISPSVSSNLVVTGLVTGAGELTATATISAQGEQHVADDTVRLQQTVADPSVPVPIIVVPNGVPVVGGTVRTQLPDLLGGATVLRIDWQAYMPAKHGKARHGGSRGRRWVTVKAAGDYTLRLGQALVGCRLRTVVTIVSFAKARTLVSTETAPVVARR